MNVSDIMIPIKSDSYYRKLIEKNLIKKVK